MKHIKTMLLLLIIIALSTSFNTKDKNKLLVFAVIDNSIDIYKTDTNWLNTKICIDIKIDTILTKDIQHIYKDKSIFKYHGKTYNKSQLFDLKKINILKDLIINYKIYCQNFEPPYLFKENSNCFEKQQKLYLRKLFSNAKKYNTKFIVMIYPTGVINTNNIVLKKIIFNPIKLTIFNCP